MGTPNFITHHHHHHSINIITIMNIMVGTPDNTSTLHNTTAPPGGIRGPITTDLQADIMEVSEMEWEGSAEGPVDITVEADLEVLMLEASAGDRVGTTEEEDLVGRVITCKDLMRVYM